MDSAKNTKGIVWECLDQEGKRTGLRDMDGKYIHVGDIVYLPKEDEMYVKIPQNYRMKGETQEHYCSRCALNTPGGCNVSLKDGEVCEDRIEDSSIPDGPYYREEGRE